MAKILVTGGAGFIGSHTAKLLNRAGHRCVVYDNLSRGHLEFVKWGPFRQGDVRDGGALRRLLDMEKIEAVIHFAALAYVGESVIAPGVYYDVNVGGTCALLQALADHGLDKVVFSSTCAVYGELSDKSIGELTKPEPINPYGITKLACERMLSDFERAYGMRHVCLRYFNAAGADPDGEVGEDHMPETHLIPLVLDAAMGRRHAVSIFGDDYKTADGTAVRDYIHVCDLAAAHVRALDYLLAGGPSRTLNLGSGRGASVAEVIDEARRVTGRPISVVQAPRRPGDPARLVADPGAAGEVLSWSCRRSDLGTILRDAWRWHEQRFSGRVV